MKRRNFLAAGGAALAGMALAGRSAWAQQQPGKLLSLHAPTRHAFVADRFSKYVSVVDIDRGTHLATLYFGIRPQVMEMARDDAMLALASPEVSGIWFLDLKTQARRFVELPSPVFQIFFVPQSKRVAIGMRDQVGIIDYSTFEVKIFERRFDSDRRQVGLNTYYSLLFSSFSESFWILDEDRPRILHKFGGDAVDSAWDEIDLSAQIGSGSGLGIGVASPEDDMLAFTVDDGSEGVIYFPQTKKLLSTGSMRTSGTTNEPMIRPYIDAYSRHVIFADVEGNVALFDLQKGDRPERFTVDFSPRIARTGWLESTWILGGDRALMFQSFSDPADRKVFRFPSEVTDIWVTGDSKTALVALDEDWPQLFRYDIRSRTQLPSVRVKNVNMVGLIRMGSNNSICY